MMNLTTASGPTQLTATGSYGDGTMKDITAQATWTSSDMTVATVAAGVVTPVAAGTTTITAALDAKNGILNVAVAAPQLVVGNFSNSSITFYPFNVTGNVAPTKTIVGNLTSLTSPRGIAISGNELFVANQGGVNAGVTVYSLDSTGNAPPVRQIAGAATTISNASGVAVFNNEIYVGQLASSVLVFPVTGNGNIAPTRTITFSGVNRTTGVSVFNNELYVADLTENEIIVCPPTANGLTAPTRVIGGAATLMNGAQAITVDNGEIFVANAYQNAVDVFPATGSGNIAPTRTITGLAFPSGPLVYGGELYVANQTTNSVLVYPTTATGAATPTRNLTGAMTTLVRRPRRRDLLAARPASLLRCGDARSVVCSGPRGWRVAVAAAPSRTRCPT